MADWKAINAVIDQEWDATIVPTLSKYIEIPNQSPNFDKEWETNGLMEKAFAVLVDWLKAQPVKGMKYEMTKEPGRTPFLIVEIDGTQPTAKTLFMYGHMDKQPPLLPWAEGLGPYTPVLRDGKLYGRGGADDGYALCASITALVALQKHGVPHARVVTIIEACEESGSGDLPFYIQKFKERIGDVDLVVCLDSGALNYDQMWLTTSLRGISSGFLTVEMMTEGIHSGTAGGIVPDSFRITRQLLDRIEDSATGAVKIEEFQCDAPEWVREGLKAVEEVDLVSAYPLLPGAQAEEGTSGQLALRNTWGPSLTVIGSDLPRPEGAGNVVRKGNTLKLSLRVPPHADAVKASQKLKEVLEANPPFGSKVTYTVEAAADGWSAPALQPWLSQALNNGCMAAFSKPFGNMGLGFSIPFMSMLGQMYPQAQFVVTGVLGPHSNAHGPNEFLHVPFAKGVTKCISRVVAEHFVQQVKS